jgi:hypothetical protein
VFDDACDDILADAIRSGGAIKPFADGRFRIEY